MVSLKHIIFIVMFSCSLSAPLKAQQYEFIQFYTYFKTAGFHEVLKSCSIGKQVNLLGESYWGEKATRISKKALEKNFADSVDIDYYISAEAKVMKETCPKVW
jgi:hypothetical protein